MNFGRKKVYFFDFVRKPRSTPIPKSLSTSLMKPAWRASSRLMKPNSSLMSLFLARLRISA